MEVEEKLKKLRSLLETDEITSNAQRLDEVCKEMGLYESQIESLFMRFEELDRKKRGD